MTMRRFLVAAMTLSCAMSGIADEPQLLRILFQRDALYRYEMTTTTRTTVRVAAQSDEPQTTSQTMQYRVSQRVVDVDERGNGVIEARIESLRVVGEMGELGSVFYDSSVPTDGSDPTADVYAGLMYKPFRMTMTSRGQIVKVEGFAELFKSASKDGEAGFDISAMLTGLLGDESWNALLQMNQPFLPETAASTWETKSETTAPLFGKLSTTSKFETLGTRIVEGAPTTQVGFHSVATATPEPVSKTLGIVRVTTNLTGFDVKGTYAIGSGDGWVVASATAQTMSLKMSIDAPGMSAGAASLEFATETTTATRRLPTEPPIGTTKETTKP